MHFYKRSDSRKSSPERFSFKNYEKNKFSIIEKNIFRQQVSVFFSFIAFNFGGFFRERAGNEKRSRNDGRRSSFV